MKLKLVQRESGRGITSAPRVSVSPKGSFYISAMAAQMLMGIGNSAKVNIFQDEDDTQAWYLSTDKDGYAKLSPKSNKKDGSAQFNLVDIAQKIIRSFHHEGKQSLKFNLQQPVNYQGKKFWKLEVVKESIEMKIPDPNGPIQERY